MFYLSARIDPKGTPMLTKTQPVKMATVVAEDAPLNVQLWPTRTPAARPNFTLERVEIIRSEIGTHVRWVYQNGERRVFGLGELVAVDGETLGDWMNA
jgi:hypothetical protein